MPPGRMLNQVDLAVLVVTAGPLNRVVRFVNGPVYRSTGAPKLDPDVAFRITSLTAVPGAVVKAWNFASPAVLTFILLTSELSSWLFVQYGEEYSSDEVVPSTFITKVQPSWSHHAWYVTEGSFGLYSHLTHIEIPQLTRMSWQDLAALLLDPPQPSDNTHIPTSSRALPL